jgi:hypothetical protein
MIIVVALFVPPRQSMLRIHTSLMYQKSFARRDSFPFPSVHGAGVYAQHEDERSRSAAAVNLPRTSSHHNRVTAQSAGKLDPCPPQAQAKKPKIRGGGKSGLAKTSRQVAGLFVEKCRRL